MKRPWVHMSSPSRSPLPPPSPHSSLFSSTPPLSKDSLKILFHPFVCTLSHTLVSFVWYKVNLILPHVLPFHAHAPLRLNQSISNFFHVLSCFSPVWLCDPVDCSPPGSSVHGDSPHGKNTGVGCQALLQGSSQPRDQTQVSYTV